MVSPAGGHIEGVVRNGKGDTVGAYLLLAPDVERLAPEMLRSVRTGANGKFVMRGRQYVAALRAVDGRLRMSTLVYADEVVPV